MGWDQRSRGPRKSRSRVDQSQGQASAGTQPSPHRSHLATLRRPRRCGLPTCSSATPWPHLCGSPGIRDAALNQADRRRVGRQTHLRDRTERALGFGKAYGCIVKTPKRRGRACASQVPRISSHQLPAIAQKDVRRDFRRGTSPDFITTTGCRRAPRSQWPRRVRARHARWSTRPAAAWRSHQRPNRPSGAGPTAAAATGSPVRGLGRGRDPEPMLTRRLDGQLLTFDQENRTWVG